MQHSFILYVDDPLASAKFYEKFLDAKPVDASPGFALFALAPPTMLGLWKRDSVEPKATAATGTNEVSFHVGSKDDVRTFFEKSKKAGAKVLQEPVQMDFGYTSTVADPDGHRLRVFAEP